MTSTGFETIFTEEAMMQLFPSNISDRFFDALYGDADEGAYDISLKFLEAKEGTLHFELNLDQRPGKCLACNLTYGLPEVFSRHPLINIKGLVTRIEELLDGKAKCASWKLGHTKEISRQRHVVPLTISIA